MKNWLDLRGLDLYGMRGDEKLHTSSHANGAEIVDMLKVISPGIVIPVHTEKPDFLKQHFDNVTKPKYCITIPL